MHTPPRETDILLQAGCSADVIAHCREVARMALSIADRLAIPSDRDLIRQGAWFHDIGRSRTHDIGHAVAGVEVGRSLGFPEQLLLIIERHVGAGITAPEAVRLGLPEKDYLPRSVEEKIVSYADNLIAGVREMPYCEALDRFKRILGPEHEGVDLFRKQHAEIRTWMKETVRR